MLLERHLHVLPKGKKMLTGEQILTFPRRSFKKEIDMQESKQEVTEVVSLFGNG